MYKSKEDMTRAANEARQKVYDRMAKRDANRRKERIAIIILSVLLSSALVVIFILMRG